MFQPPDTFVSPPRNTCFGAVTQLQFPGFVLCSPHPPTHTFFAPPTQVLDNFVKEPPFTPWLLVVVFPAAYLCIISIQDAFAAAMIHLLYALIALLIHVFYMCVLYLDFDLSFISQYVFTFPHDSIRLHRL